MKFKPGDLIRFRDFDYGIVIRCHKGESTAFYPQLYYDIWWFAENYREEFEPEDFIDETCSKPSN